LRICKDEIRKKINKSYFPELLKFLKQTTTSELKTKDYTKRFKGLKVKVSFGQGVVAKIPWISFLGKNQSTSVGFPETWPVKIRVGQAR
jgi:5-methylcytosine-specific restriction protein B